MSDLVPKTLQMRCTAVGILVALFCLLPFLNKAFTIDDPAYLFEAHQALRTPLTPAATTMCWDNIPYARPMREVGSVGLLMGYALVPVAMLNDKEWVGHLIVLLFLCCAVIATVGLAFRCGADKKQATLAGVFFASFPAVLAMAGTVMPDILATTLGVIGMERLLAWKAEGKLAQALAAGVALGLAPVAKSHTLLLLPIGMVMLAGEAWPGSVRAWLAEIREAGWRRWLPFPIALLCFFGFTQLTMDHLAVSHALFPGGPNPEQLALFHVLPNTLGFGMDWIAVTPLAIAWLLMDGRWGILLCVVAAAGAGIFKFFVPSSPILLDVLGLVGWMAILSTIVWSFRSRRFALAGLGLCLLIALPMIPYWHLPSRFIVPCAPAAAILLALRISRMPTWPALVPKVLSIAMVVVGVAVGYMILSADAAFAGLARSAVAENIAPHIAPNNNEGHRAWYSGQWALTWYAQHAGASCLSIREPRPRSGDLVIAGEVEGGVAPMPRFGLDLRLVRTMRVAEPGVRIMNQAAHAGFYANSFGFLPWNPWSRGPVNIYYVWSVE
jgi:hypothetical protein